jgi:hypothetical protein
VTSRFFRPGTGYICHIEHPNDRVYAENLSEFFAGSGVAHETIEFNPVDARGLLAAVGNDTLGVIGFNGELDHAWIDSRNFLDIARASSIPVVSCMLDHPSAAWPRFTRSYTDHSRFLFLSPYSEAYFRRFAMQSCHSACVVATGVNHRSRLGELRRDEFMAREIACMLPLNLKRIGGTIDAAEQRLAALPQHLRTAVAPAIALAQDNLSGPIEQHFFDNNPPAELLEQPYLLHHCIQIIEEVVQVRRRLAVFAIASAFPVLIQSDVAGTYVHELGAARLERHVSMRETIERMQRARAVASLTHVNDEIHNRTLNGLNAGAVNIVEDNDVHRRFFTHGKNALLFRYGDDSLRDCLELVCSRPERAFEIAEAGMSLRDNPRLRFGGYQNILEMVKIQPAF